MSKYVCVCLCGHVSERECVSELRSVRRQLECVCMCHRVLCE